ncbi:LexA family protein [Bifidobacterium crudilactis]
MSQLSSEEMAEDVQATESAQSHRPSGTRAGSSRQNDVANTISPERKTLMFRPLIDPRPVPAAMESVRAGFPSVAQDYFAGDFSFDENVILHPDTTFILTVAGDSMEGAGIFDGDLLVVDRSLNPEDDDVVVAILDDELTVKRLIMHGRTPILHPENPLYPDFAPLDGQSLEIWGVVTGNYHSQKRMDVIRHHAQSKDTPATPPIIRPKPTGGHTPPLRHPSQSQPRGNSAYASKGWG